MEAQIALGRLLEHAVAGKRPDSRVTVGELLDRYLDVADLDLSTRRTYEGYIRRTILPALGTTELRKIRGPVLDTFYTRLRRCGNLACTGRPFFEHTSFPVLQVVRRAAGRPGSRSPRRSARRSGPGSSLRARNSCRRTRWLPGTACGWRRRGMRWKLWPRRS